MNLGFISPQYPDITEERGGNTMEQALSSTAESLKCRMKYPVSIPQWRLSSLSDPATTGAVSLYNFSC